jgi:hypothetical protein
MFHASSSSAGHDRYSPPVAAVTTARMTNPYLELTAELNRGRLRALISSGQAVVMHRLAIMSKDGDWILREDSEATAHGIAVLARRGARYRFGAPLDSRWLGGGWSSHFEMRHGPLRLRADFVTRPPRVAAGELAEVWAAAESSGNEVVPLEPLAALKMTRREKDYVVIGELARRMSDPRSRLLYSRSARDLIALSAEEATLLDELAPRRPLLALVAAGREALEEALDRERRTLIHADEKRIARYQQAAEPWAAIWPEVAREIADLPLEEAQVVVAARAEDVLPFAPPLGGPL